MFPIFSLLRRLAATHIYVTPEMLKQQDGAFYVRLDRGTEYADLQKAAWVRTKDLAPMSQISVEGDSSAAVAISLATKETHLAVSLHASQRLYTLVIGEEHQNVSPEGRVVRTSRYAMVRGVYRASASTLVTVPVSERQKVQFKKQPKGIVRM